MSDALGAEQIVVRLFFTAVHFTAEELWVATAILPVEAQAPIAYSMGLQMGFPLLEIHFPEDFAGKQPASVCLIGTGCATSPSVVSTETILFGLR